MIVIVSLVRWQTCIVGSKFNMAAKREYLPSDWKDNDRMNFMFSAFPEHRHVNPKHWDSKLQFWTKTISESCQFYGDICVDFDTLRERFTRNGHKPLGLKTVVSEMIKSRELQTSDDIRSGINDGWISWSFGLAKKSASWTVGTLLWGGNSSENFAEGEKLVVTSVLQDKSESLLRIHYKTAEHEATDHIVPWNVLKARCSAGGLILNDIDLELILCHLQKQKRIVVSITSDGDKVIKFAKKNQNAVSSVVESDLDIMRLKKTIAMLTLQGKKMSNNIESCSVKAKMFVNQGLRKSALAILKKRESMQKSLDRTMGGLHTLEELLHRIQESETDKMIVETLKSGSSALKAIQEGMSARDVDKIMMGVEETLEDAEEIQQALAGNKSMAGLGDSDMDELERELEALSIGMESPQEIKGSPQREYGNDGAALHAFGSSTSPMASSVLPSVPSAGGEAHSVASRLPAVPASSPSEGASPPHMHYMHDYGGSPASSAPLELPTVPTHSPSDSSNRQARPQEPAKTALFG